VEGQLPQLPDVIKAAIAARLANIYTHIPAAVVDYDPSTQTCTAQIIIRRGALDENGNRIAEQIQQVNKVPIIFPGSGPWSITWPITAGDTVQLEFQCGSIDKWLAIGENDVDPGDDRRFAVDDATAIPGLRAIPDALTSAAYDPNALVITGPMTKIGSSAASEAPALNSELAAFIGIITGWTPVPNDGGAALKTAVTSYLRAHVGFPLGAAKVEVEKAP
jgi:hypothetical protein